jgi:hypothetical protein
MSLKDRIKRIEHKIDIDNVLAKDGITLKITGDTTEETIKNALNTIREAKQNNIEWHWISIDRKEGVDINAVNVAIIRELNKDRWGDTEI